MLFRELYFRIKPHLYHTTKPLSGITERKEIPLYFTGTVIQGVLVF